MKSHICQLFSIFLLLVPSLSNAQESLNILTWEAYMDTDMIERFELEYDVDVKVAYFDSDEIRDQILASQAGRQIDVVLMDSQHLHLYAAGDRLEEISTDEVPNLTFLSSDIQQACSKNDSHYGVAFSWGTLGIVYRPDIVDPETINSWQKFLNPPAELRQHIGGHVDLFDTLIPALISLKYSVSSNDRNELREAFELTKKWLSDVLTLDYVLTFIQSHPRADELYVALAYSGDQHVLSSMVGQPEWNYLIPSEGTLRWIDCFVIGKNSNNKRVAKQFLNFIQRPENAAKNADFTYTATPNMSALPLTTEEYRKSADIFLTPEQMAKTQPYEPATIEAINLRSRILSALEKYHATQ
ncbi:polyamine ABC transporter substrate-binding protein [Echinimonas agarilytica]|nr:spermidine/putrescine ABC transporter substrate-binding protein [Echinimonas agarilytica]